MPSFKLIWDIWLASVRCSSFSGILKLNRLVCINLAIFSTRFYSFVCLCLSRLCFIFLPRLASLPPMCAHRSLRAVGPLFCCTFQYSKNWIHSRLFEQISFIICFIDRFTFIIKEFLASIQFTLSLALYFLCKCVNTRALISDDQTENIVLNTYVYFNCCACASHSIE